MFTNWASARPRTRLFAIAGSLTAAGLIGSAAYAAIPDGNGAVYHACMLKATGTIRMIDPSLPAKNLLSHCTKLETEITWNQTGQKGDTGATGATGATGLRGDTGGTGASAYELAVSQGFTGTLDDWLASLKGARGDAGARGEQGLKGDKGEPGPALVGSSCSLASGASGTIAMDVAADGEVTLTCETGAPPEPGVCSNLPSYPHATTLCDPGTGALSLGCDVGYEDQNGDMADGCEYLAAGPGPVSNCTIEPSWPSPQDASAVEDLLNQARESNGVGDLLIDATLSAAAQWKASHLAEYGYFTYDDPAPPVSRTWYERISDCGYPLATTGEVIETNTPSATAQSIVDLWMGSAPHRAIILNPDSHAMGVGIAVISGATYAVVDFGTAMVESR